MWLCFGGLMVKSDVCDLFVWMVIVFGFGKFIGIDLFGGFFGCIFDCEWK